MRRFAPALVAAGLLFGGVGPAFAHAHLQSASPAADSTVTETPSVVTITFTEGVEPRFSSIEVVDAAGVRVNEGVARRPGEDDKQLVVDVRPLAAGTYTVTWRATAVDTHKTDGTFRFTVK